MGLAIFKDVYSVPDEATYISIGHKRGKGRPRRNAKAIVVE